MKLSMKKRLLLFFIPLLLIVVACTEKPANEVSVRLKWLFFSNYSGSVIAKEKKFFPENWDVTINQGGFEANPITLVESGSDDFGITSAIELLRARAQGIDIVAICADFQKSPVSFLVLEDSDINGVEDFPGHKVGIKYGTNTELIYKVLLEKAEVSPDAITTTPVKFSTVPLVEKTVDVFPSYFMTDPVNLEAIGVRVKTINPDTYGLECYGNILFTHANTIKEKPEMVRAFVNAYVKGWSWAVNNPEETGQIFASLNEATTAETQTEILKRTLSFLKTDDESRAFGWMDSEKWEATLEILHADPDFSSLPNSEKLDVNNCYTNKYLSGK